MLGDIILSSKNYLLEVFRALKIFKWDAEYVYIGAEETDNPKLKIFFFTSTNVLKSGPHW